MLYIDLLKLNLEKYSYIQNVIKVESAGTNKKLQPCISKYSNTNSKL